MIELCPFRLCACLQGCWLEFHQFLQKLERNLPLFQNPFTTGSHISGRGGWGWGCVLIYCSFITTFKAVTTSWVITQRVDKPTANRWAMDLRSRLVPSLHRQTAALNSTGRRVSGTCCSGRRTAHRGRNVPFSFGGWATWQSRYCQGDSTNGGEVLRHRYSEGREKTH